MESLRIDVEKGKFSSAKEARLAGYIPMIYYAKDVEPLQFTVDYQNFRRAFQRAGRSTIITLVDDAKKEYQVLVHQVQYAPVTDEIMHVDLMAIKAGQKITTDVPIVLVGESLAVKELAGILVHSKDTVSIECLPKDLPHEIEVDLSPLVDFHSSLSVGDIKAPEAITILDAEDITIATVSAPRKEEEPVVAEGEAAEGEEGEAAEGEAAEGTGEEEKAEENKEESAE